MFIYVLALEHLIMSIVRPYVTEFRILEARPGLLNCLLTTGWAHGTEKRGTEDTHHRIKCMSGT